LLAQASTDEIVALLEGPAGLLPAVLRPPLELEALDGLPETFAERARALLAATNAAQTELAARLDAVFAEIARLAEARVPSQPRLAQAFDARA